MQNDGKLHIKTDTEQLYYTLMSKEMPDQVKGFNIRRLNKYGVDKG